MINHLLSYRTRNSVKYKYYYYRSSNTHGHYTALVKITEPRGHVIYRPCKYHLVGYIGT